MGTGATSASPFKVMEMPMSVPNERSAVVARLAEIEVAMAMLPTGSPARANVKQWLDLLEEQERLTMQLHAMRPGPFGDARPHKEAS